MHFTPKKSSVLLLGVAALVCSRGVFALINDPEGPNVLVVVVLAVIIYAVFFGIYWLGQHDAHIKRRFGILAPYGKP